MRSFKVCGSERLFFLALTTAPALRGRCVNAFKRRLVGSVSQIKRCPLVHAGESTAGNSYDCPIRFSNPCKTHGPANHFRAAERGANKRERENGMFRGCVLSVRGSGHNVMWILRFSGLRKEVTPTCCIRQEKISKIPLLCHGERNS